MRNTFTSISAFVITVTFALGGASAQTQAQPASQPAPGAQQQASPPGPGDDLVKQGQQKAREGQYADALALYQKALEVAPNSVQANLQSGIVLDLMGRYADARTYFAKAAGLASTDQAKAQAARATAMSYAFERNCAGAQKYEQPLYQRYLDAKDFFNAGEVANELARVCLESADLDTAAKWYQAGHDAGVQEPNITPARRDLWEFRNEHALARIAARRGNKTEAQKHVDAAKAVFDKGTNPEQAPFVPYLVGYVAFYGGDYQSALNELQKANQNDPFILSLIAQSYEKLGNDAQAKEYYQKVLKSNAHNPTGAFARPLAQQKLGTKS